jgi:hypothetical protein
VAVPKTARWLALGMVAGQVLFTLAWFILGFVSPGFTIFGHVIAPYSAISAPLSGLGLGPTGPYMNAAFVFSGLLVFLGVIGIFQSIPALSPAARWSCIALFALSPLGMAIDGIYTIEAFLPHMIGYLLGTGTPVLGFLLAGLLFRRIPGWRRLGSWLLVASPLTLALVILSLATFDQAAVMAGQGVAGLTERILCVQLAAWFVAMGWKGFWR